MKTNLTEEKNPGFSCPNCDFFVEVTLKSLLFDSGQCCPSCLTKFTVDSQASRQSIDLMQKLNTVVENIESVKDFTPQSLV